MKLAGKLNKVGSVGVISLLFTFLASCAQQEVHETSTRDEDISVSGSSKPRLDFGCSRIAWSSDGNFHDRDDMGASALAVALLAEKGQQKRLVHWDYNSHLGTSNGSWERIMTRATEGTAKRFGYNMSVFKDSQKSQNAAVGSLRDAINASSPGNRLCLVGAGPMGVIYRALRASKSSAHPHVTLVSHSWWNNVHDDDKNRYNLVDILNKFPRVHYYGNTCLDSRCKRKLSGEGNKLPDQNRGLGTGGGQGRWKWLKRSSDSRLRYVYSIIDDMNKRGDVSDAGMMLFLITGKKSGDVNDVRGFLE